MMDNTAVSIPEIAPSSTVNDVVREFPGTLEVFRQLGVDTCCGGGATLEQAARNLQLLPDALIQTLQLHARTWQAVNGAQAVQPARHLRNAPCNCHL